MAEVCLAVIARSEATKQSIFFVTRQWIASRSLSSGAHSRDPLARNDGSGNVLRHRTASAPLTASPAVPNPKR